MAWSRPDVVVFALIALAACGGGSAAAPARWDSQKVALTIGGGSALSESPSAAPASSAKAPPSAEATPARLPAPVGAPRYALGFDRAVDGCLKGQVYAQPAGQKQLSEGYAEAPPSAALWGCEWNLNG